MPRGYRIALCAGFGWLILAGPCQGKNTEADQSKGQKAIQAKLDRIAAAIEELPKSEAPDPGCAPGRDNHQSDLCAQWKAADAAAESARWGLWTFITSLIAIGIGVGTLVAAWLAARWAKKAAEHTETGAIAAAKSVAVAEATAKQQIRAYISVESVGFWLGDKSEGLTYGVYLKNTGSSPAHEFRSTYVCFIREKDYYPDGLIKNDVWVNESPFIIGPGCENSVRYRPVKTTAKERAQLRKGTHLVFIIGAYVYRDIFGDYHRGDIAYHSHGPIGDEHVEAFYELETSFDADQHSYPKDQPLKHRGKS